MSDLLNTLLHIVTESIVSSLLNTPLSMTMEYFKTMAIVPAAIFLVGSCSLGMQIFFNVLDFLAIPQKQEPPEIREPLINKAGLYLYITCFFIILFDQILMTKVDIIFNMRNSFSVMFDYVSYLSNGSLVMLQEIKRNLLIIKTDNDNLACTALKNTINNDIGFLSSRITHLTTIGNNFNTRKDAAFENASKYTANQSSIYCSVVIFYIVPVIFAALYVYCHHYRLLNIARYSVVWGSLWFFVMILGSSAWFFVTLFIAKLCTVPKKEFITLITYFLENGDDLGYAFKEYIEHYTSCKQQGPFEVALSSLTSRTTSVYSSVQEYANTCSQDSGTITDMKIHLKLVLHYYDTWGQLLSCDNIKKTFYDKFIEKDVCQNMFVGSGTFWLSQQLCVLCTLFAIVILSYAYKVYDSDKFDAEGNLIKPKKKRRRIKWYDVRDVAELRKKMARQGNNEEDNEEVENDENEKESIDENDKENIESGKDELTDSPDQSTANTDNSDDHPVDVKVSKEPIKPPTSEVSNVQTPTTNRWPTMMVSSTQPPALSEASHVTPPRWSTVVSSAQQTSATANTPQSSSSSSRWTTFTSKKFSSVVPESADELI